MTVDLQDIVISITGFSGVDLLHLEKLITLLGANYYDSLTRKRSLLLIPDKEMNGPKVVKATEWGIPIVHVSWLWEVISKGNDQIDINPWCDNPSGTSSAFIISHTQNSLDIRPQKPAVARRPVAETILVVLLYSVQKLAQY